MTARTSTRQPARLERPATLATAAVSGAADLAAYGMPYPAGAMVMACASPLSASRVMV